MAYMLVTMLLACLLVITGCANEDVRNLGTVWDEFDLKDHLDNHEVNEARAIKFPIHFPRAALVTVTVTETVCGSGETPTISVPETTLVIGTSEPSHVPTFAQPPVSSAESAPSSAEPTSAEAPTSPTKGQTTKLQTTLQASSSTPASSSSAEEAEAPTETSDSPISTAAPTANAGFTQGGIRSLVLAIALTFIRLVGV
ncbi:hypothetical protein BJX76DRAFT_355433 [Aspergillus varians]